MHPVSFRDPSGRTPATGTLVVIPSRYQSTRLPGKPLADIAGRTMIEHVYRRASQANGIDDVIVATDDSRIAAAVEAFGGTARMTRASHQSGMDRIAEVIAQLPCAIVVNVQGDEPGMDPRTIEQVVEPLVKDTAVSMCTARHAIVDPVEYTNPAVVKVVVDGHGDALYFSRAPIPCIRDGRAFPRGVVFKHVGLYAYRRETLLMLASLPRTSLEVTESLEQLRALEHGLRIRTVETRYHSIGVDTPEDLERARRELALART